MHFLNFAVVLMGRNHNPSLINPDFLRIHEVVPEGLTPKQVVVVDPLALVEYEEGVSITVEPARMQVRESLQAALREQPLAVRIALKYVEVLPRIPYASLGMNWSVTMDVPQAGAWILANLISPRARAIAGGRVAEAHVRVAAELEHCVANLAWSESESEHGSALRLDANFHHERPEGAEGTEWIAGALARWPEYQRWMEEYFRTTAGGLS